MSCFQPTHDFFSGGRKQMCCWQYGSLIQTSKQRCLEEFRMRSKSRKEILIYSRIRDSNGEGDGTPLQYSCLENPMDGEAWWAAVQGVTRSRTRLSDFTFTFHFHALEKEMATHSSVFAWRIPGTGKPGGLPSTGSHRVGHD